MNTITYLNKEPALQADFPVFTITSFRIKIQNTIFLFVMISMSAFLSGCKLPWSNDDVSSSILLSGTIEARETDLAFQVPGRIAHLLVDEGDVVTAGQKVATLDPRDYELALARARAEADVSKANTFGGRHTATGIKGRHGGSYTCESAVKIRAIRDTSNCTTGGEATFLPGPAGPCPPGGRCGTGCIDPVPGTTGLVTGRHSRGRDCEAHQQAVSVAQQQLSYVDLTSPVAGSVTVRLAEAGEVVATGQAVLRIASLDHPWVRVYINEKDLPRIKLGQTAEVRVDGLSDKAFEGRVVFISPKAEFTPKTVETRDLRIDLVYRIKVEVDNPAGILKIGMPADVSLVPSTS